MTEQSVRLGRIAGIPVGAHWGLFVVGAIYLWSLADQILPASSPGASTGGYWLTALVAAIGFFGSILLHELGHSLMARREGIGVRRITLWLLGGVAEIEDEARSPGAEFRIAVAGPLVSVALAAVFGGVALALGVVPGADLAAAAAGWLALVNAILAVFNLVPAAPLDGGRILSAALWARNGDPHRARAGSARVGELFGTGLLALGVVLLFEGQAGLWLVILGWFLRTAAGAERQRATVFGRAVRTTVSTTMSPLGRPVDGGVTLAGLLVMQGERPVAHPVRDSFGTIVGVVPPLTVLRARGDEAALRAIDLVVPWDQFTSARTDELVSDALDRLIDTGHQHALVYDPFGAQVGYLGASEVGRLVA